MRRRTIHIYCYCHIGLLLGYQVDKTRTLSDYYQAHRQELIAEILDVA